jgi:inosine-uridine nucleoside N-ribohydrolase
VSLLEGRARDPLPVTVPIVLDCDPGHDDAIALLLALGSPEVDLLGVTTVAGNQTLEKTTANALRVLELAGRGDIPVSAGADRPLVRERFVAAYVHGESGLDGPDLPPPTKAASGTHAIDFIAGSLLSEQARTGRRVTLVPTGPLTNIALFLARYPGLVEHVERIVLMGGAIAEGNVTPAAEFNIWADPEAAHRVFASGLDVTMVGLDVTHQALMTRAHAERLRERGSVGRAVAELWDFFSVYHRETYGSEDSPIHDALAVAHVLQPELLETLHRRVDVETGSELSRGRTLVDLWRRTGRPPNAHVAVDVDSTRFLELLIERVSAL